MGDRRWRCECKDDPGETRMLRNVKAVIPNFGVDESGCCLSQVPQRGRKGRLSHLTQWTISIPLDP